MVIRSNTLFFFVFFSAYCIACDHFKRQSSADIKQALRNKLGCLRAPSRQKKM